MSRFMTRLAIKTDKYGLHVFGVDRQIRISEEIQLIMIYKSISDAWKFSPGFPHRCNLITAAWNECEDK